MRKNRLLFLGKSAMAGIALALCLTPGILANAEEAPIEAPLPETETVAETEPQAAETEAPQTEAPVPAPVVEEQITEASSMETAVVEVPLTEEAYPETSDTEGMDSEGLNTAGSEGEGFVFLEEETETETESEEEKEEVSELLPVEKAEAEAAQIPGTDPEEDPTLHQIGDEEEVAESIEGFSIDVSSYPAADTSANTRYIYNYLTKEMGFNHAAACGVLANIQLESGFNQYALGDGGTSYGICQWHNERFNRLISYCGSIGLDYNTLDGQLAYLANELPSSYSNVYYYLLGVADTADGAYDAGYYWCVYFEAPSETYERAAQRGNLARNEYYPLDLSMPETQVVAEQETIVPETQVVIEEKTIVPETQVVIEEETIVPETQVVIEEETESAEDAEENLQDAEEVRDGQDNSLSQTEEEEQIPKESLELRLERMTRSFAEEAEDNRQAVADLRSLLDEKEN